MEQRRSRRNSVSSLHSQPNSSIANVRCLDIHTHAIVQREKDNKILLVPVDQFINFGKTIKVNETASYKEQMESRKVYRGKVLVFGTEELCVDQLQVFQNETVDAIQQQQQQPDANGKSSSKTKSKKAEDHMSSMNINEQRDNQTQRLSNQNHAFTKSSTSKRLSQTNENNNSLMNAVPSLIISTNNTTAVSRASNEKVQFQSKRKLSFENVQTMSSNESTCEENEVQEKSKKKKKRITNRSSDQLTNDLNHDLLLQNRTSIESSNKTRHESLLQSTGSHHNGSTEPIANRTEEDEKKKTSSNLSKKHSKLKQKFLKLKMENEKLKDRLKFMKKHYIPIPDVAARPWFIRVVKMFCSQLSANDIAEHAKRIGIANPNQLLGCITNRGTDTARQIIRILYSQEELETSSGTTAVSNGRREAIRDFVELQSGVLQDHQFNEAINGVFRQAKCNKKKMNKKSSENTTGNKTCSGKQLTINETLNLRKSTTTFDGDMSTPFIPISDSESVSDSDSDSDSDSNADGDLD